MATAIANGIVVGVINLTLSRLLRVIDDDCKLRSDLKEDLRNIKYEMEAINAYIIQNSRRADTQGGEIPEEKIREVQELAYDIEDCVDHFVPKVTCDSNASWYQRSAHQAMTVRTRTRFAKKIKKLKQRSSDASTRIKDWTVEGASDSAGGSTPSPPYIPTEGDLDTMEESKKEILELLGEVEDNDGEAIRQQRVISILGCQGLGKTTLAKLVYDCIESRKFQCRAWVEASKYRHASILLKDILAQVMKTKTSAMTSITESHEHYWHHSDDDTTQISTYLRGLLHLEERYDPLSHLCAHILMF